MKSFGRVNEPKPDKVNVATPLTIYTRPALVM